MENKKIADRDEFSNKRNRLIVGLIIIGLAGSIIPFLYTYKKVEIARSKAEDRYKKEQKIKSVVGEDLLNLYMNEKECTIKNSSYHEDISFHSRFLIFGKDSLEEPDTLSINDILALDDNHIKEYISKKKIVGTIYDKKSDDKEKTDYTNSSSSTSTYREHRDNPKVYQGSRQQQEDLDAIDAYGAEHPEFW